jgi:hypothetical protein
VEHLLNQAGQTATTPWGRLPAAPNPNPAPSWISRFWSLLKRA